MASLADLQKKAKALGLSIRKSRVPEFRYCIVGNGTRMYAHNLSGVNYLLYSFAYPPKRRNPLDWATIGTGLGTGLGFGTAFFGLRRVIGKNPLQLERARTLWTRESTLERIEILKALTLPNAYEYAAQPWAKLPIHYRRAIAAYYEAPDIKLNPLTGVPLSKRNPKPVSYNVFEGHRYLGATKRLADAKRQIASKGDPSKEYTIIRRGGGKQPHMVAKIRGG